MFCQFIFNKEGEIYRKISGIEGIEMNAENIDDLFHKIGITEEWRVGRVYNVELEEKHFICKVIRVENDYQFIGVDVTKFVLEKENYQAQNRISDLNMNRILKTLDDLRVENKSLNENILEKDKLIKETSLQLRTSLTDVVGLIEILDVLSEEEKVDVFTTIKLASKDILNSLDNFKIN